MIRFFLRIVLCFQVLTVASGAVVSEKKRVFTNNIKNCVQNRTCSLQSFGIVVKDLEIKLTEYNELHHRTHIVAHYKTKKVSDLKDYAIVQFVRGCRFNSKVINGEVKKFNDWGRVESFGHFGYLFHFPDWVIDSVDVDPIYNSDYALHPDNPHYLYRWNTPASSRDKNTEKFYGETLPEVPELYVKDGISSAYYIAEGGYSKGTAMNNSFEFKTCVYKTADLPRTTTAENLASLPGAIHCFKWKVSKVYSHEKAAFESPQKIDAFCLEKPRL